MLVTGKKTLKSMNKSSSRVLPCNYEAYIAYSWNKFSNRFQLKDQTKTDNLRDVFYYAKCPKEQCTKDCTGETGMRLIVRVKEHSDKDSKSHLFNHSVKRNHKTVALDDFKIILKGYKRSKFRCKLAELLHIKE